MLDDYLESNARKQGIFAQYKQKCLKEYFDTEMPRINKKDDDGFLSEIGVIFNKLIVSYLYFQATEVVFWILSPVAHKAVGTCSHRVKYIRNYSHSIVIGPTCGFGNKHLVVGGHRLIKLDIVL